MIKSALALLAGASLSFAATPAAAAVTIVNYTVTGTASGTLALNFDTLTSAFTYNSSSLTVGGASYLTSSVGLTAGSLPTYILGGLLNGVSNLSPGTADFQFTFSPDTTTQSVGGFLYSNVGATFNSGGQSTITRLTATAVPEPATWAMMLIGFGGIGLALRRRPRKAAAPA